MAHDGQLNSFDYHNNKDGRNTMNAKPRTTESDELAILQSLVIVKRIREGIVEADQPTIDMLQTLRLAIENMDQPPVDFLVPNRITNLRRNWR